MVSIDYLLTPGLLSLSFPQNISVFENGLHVFSFFMKEEILLKYAKFQLKANLNILSTLQELH